MSKRYLSGVQPTGELHLGNYFGAIRRHIETPGNAFYFIANFHALTSIVEPDVLRRNTREVAATYLALGLDTSRATLFRQSDVPEVTELAWLLATVTSKGLLDRAVSYKDKVAKGINAGLGLYFYPVLMAADILAYESDVVPVGSDQVQHVEMCRDMARSFNSTYGDVFTLPEYEVSVPVPVPGIDGQKMSKSYGNTIPIFAAGRALRDRVMAIVTDSTPLEAVKNPDTCIVHQLYRLLVSETEADEMARNYRAGNYGYGSAKTALLKRIEEHFRAPRERYALLMAQPDELETVLRAGGARAREIARRVLDRARTACGI